MDQILLLGLGARMGRSKTKGRIKIGVGSKSVLLSILSHFDYLWSFTQQTRTKKNAYGWCWCLGGGWEGWWVFRPTVKSSSPQSCVSADISKLKTCGTTNFSSGQDGLEFATSLKKNQYWDGGPENGYKTYVRWGFNTLANRQLTNIYIYTFYVWMSTFGWLGDPQTKN